MKKLVLDGCSLHLDSFIEALSSDIYVELSQEAIVAMQKSRNLVEEWLEHKEVVYGITTGFGEFANVSIPHDQIEALQENLILSHSAGIGPYIPDHIVKGMMILRVNALAKGLSGIRVATVQSLLDMINCGIIPAVPSQGSVGSSGDLAPLSHIALALIGKGKCILSDGSTILSEQALKNNNIEPVKLSAKEGLALINGTQMMCTMGAIGVHKAMQLCDIADISGALSLEALRGTDKAFDEKLQIARGFTGQIESARRLRALLKGSEIRESHRVGDGLVQDAYSLRCMPQVHGASRDAIQYVKNIIETELNAANDNPLIFSETKEHIEGGNFHGQPLALALDFLAIACAELGSISERRTERLVNGALSNGLPRFLTKQGGLQSGMMIAQYTSASLVSENKVLCHPASVDSIPTSANQEDHNSMGSISARKALDIIQNVQSIIAIELLCASQGIDFHKPLQTSPLLQKIHHIIRESVPFEDTDSIVHNKIIAILHLVQNNALDLTL